MAMCMDGGWGSVSLPLTVSDYCLERVLPEPEGAIAARLVGQRWLRTCLLEFHGARFQHVQPPPRFYVGAGDWSRCAFS